MDVADISLYSDIILSPSTPSTNTDIEEQVDINEKRSINGVVMGPEMNQMEINVVKEAPKAVSISDLIGYRVKKKEIVEKEEVDPISETESSFLSQEAIPIEEEQEPSFIFEIEEDISVVVEEEVSPIIDPELRLQQRENLRNILSGNRKSSEKSLQTSITETMQEVVVVEEIEIEEIQEINQEDFIKASPSPSVTDPSLLVTLKVPNSQEQLLLLEDKIHATSNAKKVSARDLFKSMKPKPKPIVEKQLIPSKVVTLAVSSDKLREIQERVDNPFFTKGNRNGKSNGQTNDSFLRQMFDRAASTPKLTSFQKLKEVPLPILTRDEFHIDVDNNIKHRTVDFQKRDISISEPTHDEESLSNFLHKEISRPTEFHMAVINVDEEYTTKKAAEIIPSLYKDPRFSRILPFFSKRKTDEESRQLWCNTFKPRKSEDLLIPRDISSKINKWLTSSFRRLEKASGGPRFKKQKKQNNEIDDFIIDDFLLDEDLTEEEIFVPIMIISGDAGACKSSTIYACVEELGGYVYEINSGQARGRKDILANLKELSTTQLVHQSGNKKQFQKGVILFEDVDILFEQDRTFWGLIQEILNISRRPIIMTCSSVDLIPTELINFAIEEYGLFELNPPNYKILSDYLRICCLTRGFEVDADLVGDLIKENRRDLRKCFMELQCICQQMKVQNSIVVIDDEKDESIVIDDDDDEQDESIVIDDDDDGKIIHISRTGGSDSIDMANSLIGLSEQFDLLSAGDIITASSNSLINHEEVVNELINAPIIDDSTLLKQNTLPYELNIGCYLSEQIPYHKISPTQNYTPREIRSKMIEYYETKLKRNQFTFRATRISSGSFYQTETIQLKSNSIFHVSTTSELVCDLAPTIRCFAALEKLTVLSKEATPIQNNDESGFSSRDSKFNGDPDIALSTFYFEDLTSLTGSQDI